jgi:hypothetical protein
MTSVSEPTPPPPDAVVFQAITAFMVSRSLSAVAELGVADHLRDRSLSASDLARAVGANERFLFRVMRLLVSAGLFAEPSPGTYALTPSSELLRSDHPNSLRDLTAMITSESHWRAWGELTDAIRTGTSGSCLAFGTDAFSWFQRKENKAHWDLFNAAMTSYSAATSMAVVNVYDFSRFRHIIDVGGGRGFFLRTALAKATHASGTLFDLPGVFEGGDIDTLGGRIACVGGDFFTSVPEGGDCYVLKHIVHDWDDERCRTFLGNIARVMDPAGRVIVVDMVMPEGPEPAFAKVADINMLAFTEGGSERTEREFASLFDSAGLQLKAIHTTPIVSAVEAVKRP